jgi:hypothetical protein
MTRQSRFIPIPWCRVLAIVLPVICALTGAYSVIAAEVSWSIVVMPDTQRYDGPVTWGIFNQITQWIVDNKDSRNIKLVLHEGDITNDNTDQQWAEAANAMSRLNGQIPYIVVTGNHDYDELVRSTTKLNDYFHLEDNPLNNSPDGILTTQYIPGKMERVYSTFTAPDGRKMLVFGLEALPYQASTTTWVNSIAGLPEYQDYTAVVLTHCNLAEGPATPDGEPTTYREPAAEYLWDLMVRKHSNIELVLNGHALDGTDSDPNGRLTTARQDSTGDHGNTVHEIAFNVQQQPNGGNGYLRLLEFLDDGVTVQVRTYSPYLDKWLTNDRNEFQIQLTPAVPGDYNHNGVLDAADYTVWRDVLDSPNNMPHDATPGKVDESDYYAWESRLGNDTATPMVGDYNGNGIVDAADYTVWRDGQAGWMPHDATPGSVDESDYDYWLTNFGSSTEPGKAGDYNANGLVDAADYTVWRDSLDRRLPHDATPESIDQSDYDAWMADFGNSADVASIGDYNDDGFVNAADYTVWLEHMNRKLHLTNDHTFGVVDEGDFDFWKLGLAQSLGSASAAGTSTAHVPEPSTIVLAIGLPVLFLRSRRQEKRGKAGHVTFVRR